MRSYARAPSWWSPRRMCWKNCACPLRQASRAPLLALPCLTKKAAGISTLARLKAPCCRRWVLTPWGWMPWWPARAWMRRRCRWNCWSWSWMARWRVCPAACTSGWAAPDAGGDLSLPGGTGIVLMPLKPRQSSSRSGFASSLASASRVARKVRAFSSWATSKPACKPAARLQFLGPGHHGVFHRGAVVGDHVNGRSVDTQHHFDVVGIERHVAQRGVANKVLQIGQALGHGVNVGLRDGGRLGQEGIGQGVGEDLDLGVLRRAVHAHEGQPLAQSLQQARKILDDLRAVAAVGLGTGGPDEVGGCALERDGVCVLGAVAHGREGQDFGPGLEQKLADLVAHRHVAQHGAQLDGVLDRQRLPLLHLLSHSNQAGRSLFFGEELGQEFLELVVDE